MAGGARLLLVGLLLVTAKGKMTFLSVFILGRHQKECWSSCSFPVGRSEPRDIPVCHSSDAPFAQAGARLDQSTVLIRVIEILGKE